MKVSDNLIKLAEEFKKENATLYIVGGFVRDSLLKYKSKDIDLSSNLAYEKVSEICKHLKFKCEPINQTLGTILISTKNEHFEYTRFRVESYNNDGKHQPTSTQFVDDIKLDVKRRDLTINALYYDIVANKIIDMVDGLKDLDNHIIRTVNDPYVTLKDDGLRILRCIRFSCALDFDIEPNTFDALQLYSCNIANVSKPRVLEELKKIVVADEGYRRFNLRLFDLLCNFDIPKYLFHDPILRLQDITEIAASKFYLIDEDYRIYLFYMYMYKYYCNRYLNPTEQEKLIEQTIGQEGLQESKETIKLVKNLLDIYLGIQYKQNPMVATAKYLSLEHNLKPVVKLSLTEKASLTLLCCEVEFRRNHLPLTKEGLKINARTLILRRYDKKYISEILDSLFIHVLQGAITNTRKELLFHAKKIYKCMLIS